MSTNNMTRGEAIYELDWWKGIIQKGSMLYLEKRDVPILDMAIEALEEQKTGEWTREWLPSTNGGCYEVFRCSECEQAFNWRMKYCGNCGARMEGEEDE